MSSGQIQDTKTHRRVVDLVPFFTAGGANFSVQNLPEALPVTGVCFDSRQVEAGNVFVCLPGTHTDGNQFVKDAIVRGAACIVSQQAVQTEIPTVIVPDSHQALACIADYFYDHPSLKVSVIGVTGTNGKTTTTHLIEHIFNQSGRKTGLMGTFGNRAPGQPGYKDSGLTTPQSSDVHKFLYEMHELGCNYVCMEVSSHALELGRVAACQFAVAVMTNITQDHLDFHKTMENYTQAKLSLFTGLNKSCQHDKSAVINLDDSSAQLFMGVCGNSVRKLTYGMHSNPDVKPTSVNFDFQGMNIDLQTPIGNMSVKTRLSGSFNVYNLMAAVAVAIAEGITLSECSKAISSFEGVPGRFEIVSSGKEREPLCIVDYAHTPDGLENVLTAAKSLVPNGGNLTVVFGCGGDRDAGKRPKMGRIAEFLADQVIVTSDNPRSENPDAIIKEIVTGINSMDKVKVELNREAAIQLAISAAGERDVVVIAGKGHENYQILGDRTIEFDDRIKVLEVLRSRGSA